MIRRHILAAILFAVVYAYDILTPPANVSVCFAYIAPMLLAVYHSPRTAYRYCFVGLALSVLGIFPQTPGPDLFFSFYASRVAAIACMFLTADLIYTRLQKEEIEGELRDRQGAFISILSHEIRSHLTVVDGQAGRLMKLSPSEDLSRRAAKIRDSSRHLVNLMERILEFSALAGGEIRPAFQPVDLSMLLDSLSRRFAEDSPGRQIRTSFDALPALVRADACLLTSVFENLISNALKFSAPAAPIEIAARMEQAQIAIAVRDQGIGIPAEALPRLFTPFFRASNSAGIAGAGIGLYICQRIAALHGGRVEVQSRLREGTTVTVLLAADPA